MPDDAFTGDAPGLRRALDLLLQTPDASTVDLHNVLPESGLGEIETLELLAPYAIGGARKLSAATAFAHMDPPTPWITWATAQWNAALNQNLLHPDVAPVAIDIEKHVVAWLAPFFGMNGGHMTPGSTISNLTALWAARDIAGIKRVVASSAAHVSVRKAAKILGLEFVTIPADPSGALRTLPDGLDDAAVVLTAGTTSHGAIDTLTATAAWVHVDAAWAGPLRLSTQYAQRLDGIEAANSVAVSAHKWLFQPKESGLVFFKDTDSAHEALSFGSQYLQQANVGVLGSHGAHGLSLLATLLAWGRSGVAQRIDKTMNLADSLLALLQADHRIQCFGENVTGVLLWRPQDGRDVRELIAALPAGLASYTEVNGVAWVRQVAANPSAEPRTVFAAIDRCL